MSESQTSHDKTQRKDSQIKAEKIHETHRVSHKIAANKKTTPFYAEKMEKYKNSGKLTALIHEAILNAPDNPDNYTPKKTPKF